MTSSTESDLVTQLSTEAAVLYGGAPVATIPDSELNLVFGAFPEGCFSDTLKTSIFTAARIPVGQGLDAGQLVRICRALEQQCSVTTVSLLESVCAAAYHRVFVAVDYDGHGFLDEVGCRQVLEAFGLTSSQIAGVRAAGARDNIYADEIGKLVRLAIKGEWSKQRSMFQALNHVLEARNAALRGAGAGGARRGGGGAAAAAATLPVSTAASLPTDPTCAELVAMLDFRANGGANMKEVADACYASLPVANSAQIDKVLSRTIELAQGALLDEVALKTFLEHHLAQYAPGMSLRAIVRALTDGACMKFLAVAGVLAVASNGAVTTAGAQDSRHRPLTLTPFLEAVGLTRSQITSSYQASVSINDAVRRIFKAHAGKQPGAMKMFLSHRSKVSSRAGPRHNPPPPGSDDEKALFEEVFTLLDSRGLSALSFDNVMEYLEPIPNAPDPSIVDRIFEEVDADHNQNLVRDEFKEMLYLLERAHRAGTFGAQLQCFREFAHRKMFEIADKDGGGTIDKAELRMIMESVGASTTEIAMATKDMPNELSLDEFTPIIAPFSRGKSLAQIVETGNKLQKQTSSIKESMKRFQDIANKTTGVKRNVADVAASVAGGGARSVADVASAAVMSGAGASAPRKMCFSCAELDSNISTLTAQIENLKLDLSKSEYAADVRSTSAESQGDSRGNSAGEQVELIDDLLRGDLFKGMRAFENIPAAAFFKKYPQLSKSFIHRVSSQRVVKVMESMMANQKDSLTNAHSFTEAHKRRVEELMEQLTVDIEMIVSDINEFWQIASDLIDRISNPTNIDKERVQFRLVDLNAARQKVQGMASDLEWISERVIEWSCEAVDLSVVAAPFSSRISDVLTNVLYLDSSTVALVEALSVIAFMSSSQPCDAEVWARRVLSGTHACVPEEAVPELKHFAQQATTRLGTLEPWERLRNEFKRAFSLLHRALSRSTAMKKDKAVFTQGNASYAFSVRALAKREGGQSQTRAQQSGINTRGGGLSTDHPAFVGLGDEGIIVSTPRLRHRRPEITDPVRFVDKLLESIQEREPNLPIPANFRRIDPQVNAFWFNEKIIDLIPSDNNCVVKVGGGYVMFEEYCSKYGRGSTTDLMMAGHGAVGIAMDQTANAGFSPRAMTHGASGRGMTPRSGGRTTMASGSSSPNTPRRVLVRQGRGVVLHQNP